MSDNKFALMMMIIILGSLVVGIWAANCLALGDYCIF